MTKPLHLLSIALLVSMSTTGQAQSLFKCKQADGTLSYQGDPCPVTSSQQVLKADVRGTIKVVPPEAQGVAPLVHPVNASVANAQSANKKPASSPPIDASGAGTTGDDDSLVHMSFGTVAFAVFSIIFILALIHRAWHRRHWVWHRKHWNTGSTVSDFDPFTNVDMDSGGNNPSSSDSSTDLN